MFKSKFHYKIDSDKQIASVSPTAGTIVKWVVIPTLLSLASLIPMWFTLNSIDDKFSVTDELDKALSEDNEK